MPLNTKMELHDTITSKLAEISYFSGANKYTANDICEMIEFLVDNIYVRFDGQLSKKWLAFLWEQTVPHYWLTCFSIPTKVSF